MTRSAPTRATAPTGRIAVDRYARPAPSSAAEARSLTAKMVVENEHGVCDFAALRSASRRAPQRLVFNAFDLLRLDGQDPASACIV